MKGRGLMKTKILTLGVAAGFLGGCNMNNLSDGQTGALVGAAAGTGIGLATGGSFGAVVGAGLIGGAVGYIGGTAIGNK